MVAPPGPREAIPAGGSVRVKLLGHFIITVGNKSAGEWPRPVARRLCQLVLVSPGHRLSREVACDTLFPALAPRAAAHALSKALSMARGVLGDLGGPATEMLVGDRTHIYISPNCPLDVDVECHEAALQSALRDPPGIDRDTALSGALADNGALLEDEAYADWALRPRDRLEVARHEARLALARDRSRGDGRLSPEFVVKAWEDVLAHEPASEEAATGLMRTYAAQGQRHLAVRTYQRCCAGLEELGLHASPALEEIHRSVVGDTGTSTAAGAGALSAAPLVPGAREERKVVSALFAELMSPLGGGERPDPEDLREVVGSVLAAVIAEVESLGGTVTSVGGGGIAALFGAPLAHEDDPERAVRAGLRILTALAVHTERFGSTVHTGTLGVRVGIETGEAVLGLIGGAGRANYGAVGEVLGTAALLQSVASPRSVLVGPVTRAATEGLFEWGPSERISLGTGPEAIVASYVARPRARNGGFRGKRTRSGHVPMTGRDEELSTLFGALRQTVRGSGCVATVVGEPGLGKTRLVQECRKRFMAWVGAGSGRLPLWMEGRCASYAASTPYGLYQQLLASWMGVVPDQGEEVVRRALARAMTVLHGHDEDERSVVLLSRMMGLSTELGRAGLDHLGPQGLQRATFAQVRRLISRLVARGLTVLVLEDLHWADATSLCLTEELALLTRKGPLLVLTTRRPEPDPGSSTIEDALAADRTLTVLKIELRPLTEEAEKNLAQALIGADAPATVVDAVRSGAEGNPLLLEEKLASLLDNGALVKDARGWHLDQSAVTKVPDFLDRLIRSRIDRLPSLPREAIVAASVLGREFGLPLLGAVCSVDGLEAAMEDLCKSGLVEEVCQLPSPAYRFRHALIQVATYNTILRRQRRQLHRRAAIHLEEISAERLEEVAALLGQHYAAAGEPDRAVRHFEVAGDHAAGVYANEDAVASYRSALAIVNQDRSGRDVKTAAAVELRAKLGEVLQLIGRHREARDVLHEAIGLVGADDPSRAAYLHHCLGRVEIFDRQIEAAKIAFDTAANLLGDHPEAQADAIVNLWLEIELSGRAQVHYWRDQPDGVAAVLNRARPVVEARGGPEQRYRFYEALNFQQLTKSRHFVDEDILANARAALKAAEEGCTDYVVGFALFELCFCLLFHGDLSEAEETLMAARRLGERMGEADMQMLCLSYLNLTALRRHTTAGVASLAPQAMAAAEAASRPEYAAMARASLAWLAWNEGRFADVRPRADEALISWETTVWHPLHWICLWPLIAARVAAGETALAIAASRELLRPPQQRLPDDLESAVQNAIATWEEGDHQLARSQLAQTVELAERLRYL